MLVSLAWSARANAQVLVHVATNASTASAWADSMYLGPARSGPFMVGADTRRIQLVYGQATGWSLAPVGAPLDAADGDTVYLRLHFPLYHRIESHPFGATAYLINEGSKTQLGTTPLTYSSPEAIRGRFALELAGYQSAELEPGVHIWNRYETRLVPVKGELVARHSWQPVQRWRWWIDAGIGVAAVTAGAVAVHYKFQADAIDDDYRQTGDPTLRPRIARLDDRSGVALGVMQAGLMTLAVRFALR